MGFSTQSSLCPLPQWLSPSGSSDDEEQLLEHAQFLHDLQGKRLPQDLLHSADEVLCLQLNVQMADVIAVLQLGLGFLNDQVHPVAERAP